MKCPFSLKCFQYRGASLTVIMFDQVFNQRLIWIETLQIIFVIIGSTMGAIGFMILFIGFLATGATRHKVYRAWGSRIGGRISCAIFMTITYMLNLVWLMILVFLVVVTFVFTVFWNLCSNTDVETHRTCIDLTQFIFMFPQSIRQEDLRICDKFQVKAFCKDAVEPATTMYILACVSCLLVILSLVHYMICLAANYAHIRDHEKLQELQELQYLQEIDQFEPKEDRF